MTVSWMVRTLTNFERRIKPYGMPDTENFRAICAALAFMPGLRRSRRKMFALMAKGTWCKR